MPCSAARCLYLLFFVCSTAWLPWLTHPALLLTLPCPQDKFGMPAGQQEGIIRDLVRPAGACNAWGSHTCATAVQIPCALITALSRH